MVEQTRSGRYAGANRAGGNETSTTRRSFTDSVADRSPMLVGVIDFLGTADSVSALKERILAEKQIR